jgi:glutathione S-transferase
MITLFQPPAVWGLPSMSPFCAKLETYLRMAKIEYKTAVGNPFAAPKGKIPYVKIDDKVMGDSSLIILELKKKFGDPLDQHLTSEERARGLALQRLVEDHMYFATAWLRWSDAESWSHVRAVFKSLVPPVIGPLILLKIRRGFLKALWSQGTGRHTRDEIIQFAKEDLTALSVLLEEKPYFLGDRPTSFDATMYGFLIQQLWVPWGSPIKDHVRSLENLVAFCERMKKQYWS